MKIKRGFLFAFFFFAIIFPRCSQQKEDKVFWTHRQSPQVIGKLVTDDLLSRKEIFFYPAEMLTAVHYAEACTAFGAAQLAGLAADSLTIRRLADRYLTILEDGPENSANHVDANVYGILPLELYKQNGDARFFKTRPFSRRHTVERPFTRWNEPANPLLDR